MFSKFFKKYFDLLLTKLYLLIKILINYYIIINSLLEHTVVLAFYGGLFTLLRYNKLVYAAFSSAILSVFIYSTAFADYAKTNSNLNLRSQPNTDSQVITLLKSGKKIEVLSSSDGWSKVNTDGKTGYVKSEFIYEVSADEADTSVAGYANTTSNLNLRSGPSTDHDKITLISEGQQIEVISATNGWSKIKFNSKTGYVKSEFLRYGSDNSYSGGVELTPWSQAKQIFTIGKSAKIYDIYTGKVYYVKSFSNGSHADVEPVTAQDTATMKSTYGGVWKWDPRPVLVTINGHTMAASINGMPHGGGVNDNNGMNGQVCIHFKGSSAHNGNYSFTNWHQEVLMEAYSLSR